LSPARETLSFQIYTEQDRQYAEPIRHGPNPVPAMGLYSSTCRPSRSTITRHRCGRQHQVIRGRHVHLLQALRSACELLVFFRGLREHHLSLLTQTFKRVKREAGALKTPIRSLQGNFVRSWGHLLLIGLCLVKAIMRW
jgi:hypothetical protein